MAQLAFHEVLPRYEEENVYNYTPLEKAERMKALRDMTKDYPTLPRGWLEMAYDYWKNTPKTEVETIINSKAWEEKGKFSNHQGGIIQCMEVLSFDDLAKENEDSKELKVRYKGIHGLDGEADDTSGNS